MHLTCIQGQTYFKNLRHLPVCIASKTGKYGKIMPKITRENHFRVFLEDLFILIFKMYAKMKI